MKEKLLSVGVTEEALAAYVRKAADSEIQAVKGEGIDAQIRLINLLGFDDEQLWEWIVSNEVTPGFVVKVAAPKAGAEHPFPFTGSVTAVYDDGLEVQLSDGQKWGVSFLDVEHYQAPSEQGNDPVREAAIRKVLETIGMEDELAYGIVRDVYDFGFIKSF